MKPHLKLNENRWIATSWSAEKPQWYLKYHEDFSVGMTSKPWFS